MTLSVAGSGTQTAVVNTEHTLLTSTSSGTYQTSVNLLNMVAGDEVELRVYTKTLTGDAQNYLAYSAYYTGDAGDGAASGGSASGEMIVFSPPVGSPYQFVATLKQVAGTARSFPWRVDLYA